mmetsp:Transcript_12031/g.39579  ORF Transcript_12031/g.39579 Transcript_12031/m.39579 type:complete len:132 (+) Transcript_12031:11-406(+)
MRSSPTPALDPRGQIEQDEAEVGGQEAPLLERTTRWSFSRSSSRSSSSSAYSGAGSAEPFLAKPNEDENGTKNRRDAKKEMLTNHVDQAYAEAQGNHGFGKNFFVCDDNYARLLTAMLSRHDSLVFLRSSA